MGEAYAWAYVGILTVVPVVVAFLFFKLFPASRAVVKGPFKGLNLKMGGAFGGYFATALLLSTLIPRPSTRPDFETWTVVGGSQLETGEPATTADVCASLPDGGVANGNLSIRGVPVPTRAAGGVTTITIRQGEYFAQVPLTNEPPRCAIRDTYRFSFDSKAMVIDIDRAVVLRRLP